MYSINTLVHHSISYQAMRLYHHIHAHKRHITSAQIAFINPFSLSRRLRGIVFYYGVRLYLLYFIILIVQQF